MLLTNARPIGRKAPKGQHHPSVLFRLSDHELMIEEGRHLRAKIPRENTLCKICKDKVQDMQHKLVKSKLYGQRQSWFSKIGEKISNFNLLNDHQKFVFLMTQEDNQLEPAKNI